jgi:hypothetical protein
LFILITIAQRNDALLVPLQGWISNSKVAIEKNHRKVAALAVAVVCLCGLPVSTYAAESPSLETQLKRLQEIKISNQKRRIEAAELELQSKELLYPEGRLIGRGIVKLMPENGWKDFCP